MANYLVSTIETYRVDTEAEAMKMIEDAKHDNAYALKKYTNEYKERTAKGEIIDEYWKLTLTKTFNDIKDTGTPIIIDYKIDK